MKKEKYFPFVLSLLALLLFICGGCAAKDEPLDNVPGAMLEGRLYTLDLSRPVAEQDDKTFLCTVTEITEGYLLPSEDGQANFPAAENADCYSVEDGYAIHIAGQGNSGWYELKEMNQHLYGDVTQ